MELFQAKNFNFKVHTPTLFFEKCVIRIFQNRHRRADILTIQSRNENFPEKTLKGQGHATEGGEKSHQGCLLQGISNFEAKNWH